MKEFSKEVYLKWYEDMTMWRRFEDKCRSLYLKQKIRGFFTPLQRSGGYPCRFYTCNGFNQRQYDYCLQMSYPSNGNGVDPKRIMAELCGKVTGTSHGMGGSMHILAKSTVSTEVTVL